MKLKTVINTCLATLRAGQTGRVRGISGAGAMVARLADLGFVPGTEFRLIRVAPLGDPVEVEIRGARICLRRRDLETVHVEVDP